MLAEWSVECAPDDPVLVVPWSSEQPSEKPSATPTAASAPHFIDLRENPYDLDHLPEAEQFPPLMHALRALNASRSPVFTAKCDAWPLTPEELSQLRTDLDLDLYLAPDETPSGFGSYIDLLLRDRSLFASFHQNEQLLHRLSRRAAPLDHPHAMLDCIIRPAMVDLTGPQEGFAVTLYVKALGPNPQGASDHWAGALDAVVALLRGKDLI
ncbi:hypothetical protein [Granulicella sp. dw_53]|uniref:hypothetical protein n=1 Tax=Granulicella sp. dw_53 TaxID=2719792 RepID=UPI001BD4A57A|nr:hypothetical protein [Granulicella sp. dw_53]